MNDKTCEACGQRLHSGVGHICKRRKFTQQDSDQTQSAFRAPQPPNVPPDDGKGPFVHYGQNPEIRCECCLHELEAYGRWCSLDCASKWEREFYWPAFHVALGAVLRWSEYQPGGGGDYCSAPR